MYMVTGCIHKAAGHCYMHAKERSMDLSFVSSSKNEFVLMQVHVYMHQVKKSACTADAGVQYVSLSCGARMQHVFGR